MTTDEVLSAITAELSAIGAATDLGLVIQDGDRVATVLMIDDRRFGLSLEPAQANGRRRRSRNRPRVGPISSP